MGGPSRPEFAILRGMSHAQLAAAHPHHPAHNADGYPAHYGAQENPEGMAAIGSVLGAMVASGIIGNLVAAVAIKMPVAEVDVEVEDATQEEMQEIMTAEYKGLTDAQKAWFRKRHGIKAVFGTVGSALGAYLGAGPTTNRKAAAAYAALGTGAVRAINVAAALPVGLPGYLTGALGAYYGSQQR